MKTLRVRTTEGIIPAMDVLYEDARKYLEDPDHAGRGVTLTLRSMDWMTFEQIKKFMAMCSELANQATLHGQKLDKDSWSAVIIAGLRKDQRVIQGLEGGLVLVGGSKKDLSMREASDCIEIAYATGANHVPPVIFKEPKEQKR